MTLADGIWQQIFTFDHYGELLALVRNSLIAGAALGLVGGLVGVFVIMRDLPFAVHGISELSFAGASAALLLGVNIVAGSIVGSILAAGTIGLLGSRARDRNSVIGTIMPFGLGLGVLVLALYEGAMWRPLAFASADPEVAEARGVPVRALSFAFMIVLGLAVALSVQIVGALLVLTLVLTPAAAAARITASPVLLPVLSVVFAVVSIEGGILLALGSSIPISPYVTTISFAIYLVCRLAGTYRTR